MKQGPSFLFGDRQTVNRKKNQTNGKSEAYLSERNDIFMTRIRETTALRDARK